MDLETLEALAFGDADAALARLVPGTVDADRFRVLRHQRRGELAAARAILDPWVVRHGGAEPWATLLQRQRVLEADADLETHGRTLGEALGLSFAHPRELPHAPATHPSRWSQPSVEELVRAGVRHDRGLSRLTDLGARAAGVTGPHRRAVLPRLRRGGVPGLVEAIAQELGERDAAAFGGLAVHQELLLDELDALAALVPRLRSDREWALARIARHRPPPHVDLGDRAARAAWVEELCGLVAGLPPTLGDLRVHALGHRLRCDRLADRSDAGNVLAYLALPRRASYARDAWIRGLDSRHVAAQSADLSRWTGLEALPDDTALVRHHVGRLLAEGAPATAFEEWIDGAWLRELEAEVRVLAGDPDEGWSRRLGAAAIAALRDRVEITLPDHLPAVFARDAAVVLDVEAKNCWPLRLRVHRIDVPAAFAATGAELASDVDLDGLVARVERTLDADAPPAVRRRLRVPIPEIDRPGTWIVELFGGGVASRAVIRRGSLRAATRPTADGTAVTVLDADGVRCPGARVRIGTADHGPDDRGEIHLPFGSGQAAPALLVDGDLAVADRIHLRAEVPALHLAVALDHQALVPGATATAVLRLALSVGGEPAPIGSLEDAWVEVTTVDRTGVPASRRQRVDLDGAAELVVPLPIPEHLDALRIAAGGRYRVASQQRHEVLRAEQSVEVAGFSRTDRIESVHRVPTAAGEALRVLGRTGEPVAGRALAVRFTTRLLRDPVEVALATDADGTVHLGPLPEVTRVEARLGDAAAAFDVAPPPAPPGPTSVCAGELVRVPWRGRWRLVELRAGAPASDRSGLVRPDDGHLAVTLPAGRYRLEGDDPQPELVIDALPASRPADGAAVAVPMPAMVAWAAPAVPVLGVPEVDGDRLRVRVYGSTPDTRVHVLASPAAPEPVGAPGLAAPTATWPARRASAPESAYLSGRDLGDELRYVLDRATLPRRPGSLLQKPSLLVSPWALRTTSTRVATARGGGSWAAAPAPPPGAAPAPAASARMREEAEAQSASAVAGATSAWDFLSTPAVAVANLRPAADGSVVVPLAGLPAGSLVVHLVDPGGAARREVVREPPARLAARDRRLAAALPDARHFAEVRTLSAGPGGARAARVDALEAVYRALCDLSGAATLAAWDFLPRWRHLPREERLRLWNEHACHELALFVFHRDPELFAALAPTLGDKLEPGFVDDWVLRRPLDRWLVPWRFARLDVVERALLARARPDHRDRIARGLADEAALRRPDRARDDRLVDALMGGSGESPPPPAEPQELGLADAFGGPAGGGGPAAPLLDFADADDEAPKQRAARAPAKAKKEAARPRPQELWRAQDLTREWAEHQWHQTPRASAGPSRVAPSRLWRDFAAHGEGPFLPASLADAADGFSVAVCALAVIGVEPGAIVAEAALVAAEAPDGSVLVGQHVVRADDRFAWDGDQQREKPVGDELVTRVVYTGVVAVTNPSSRHRRLGALIQIPAGAIALGGALATRTVPLELGPYATATLEVSYYFPSEGVFAQYGCRVAEAGRVVAAAPGRSLRVVRVPTLADAESWAWLSQEAPLDVLLEALGRTNLHRVDLGRLAWRMAERPAFDAITAALAARDAWHPDLWGYALRHGDRRRAGELLDRLEGLAARVAPIDCGLFVAEPVDRGLAEHLEYAPLVNARAHRLGARREVLNDGLAAHWAGFLDRLAVRGGPTPAEALQIVQQLFAMDRADEAAARLAALPAPEPLPLQHAWLRAHAATLAGELDVAMRLAAPHLDHPIPRWRARFQAVAALVDEVRGARPRKAGVEGRDARMSELAASEPALSARVEGGDLVLETAHLSEVVVRVHPLDVEVLFSREPFLAASADRFAVVEPADVRTVPLEPSGATRVPLAALARANVAIEVRAGALRRVVTRLAHDLAVTVASGYGQLQVRRASTGAPLPGAYVKVFAGARGGGVAFYKDGYTDPAGRFDHATLSTDDLDRTGRFAILVVHDTAGAVVLEADPPTR